MNKGAWKKVERKVADLLRGKRNPLSGRASLHTAGDVIHPFFYVEVKHRKRMAVYTIWDEAREQARKENKCPLLVIKMKGRRGELVILRLQDFIRLVREEFLEGEVDWNALNAGGE